MYLIKNMYIIDKYNAFILSNSSLYFYRLKILLKLGFCMNQIGSDLSILNLNPKFRSIFKIQI
jgi:hypothetical protein